MKFLLEPYIIIPVLDPYGLKLYRLQNEKRRYQKEGNELWRLNFHG
jgi:hypothetical protein